MTTRRRWIESALAAAGAGLGTAAMAAPAQATQAAASPVLLTVTGPLRRPNRGPLDPALDQLMAKQQIQFTQAHAFDFAALTRLPARSLRPTLEYDAKPHRLRGPLLADVLQAAGAPDAADTALALRALDGYTARVSLGDARRLGLIVATHLDDRPMALGGLGPLWAVLDADRVPELAAKPLAERFALCPWGLYHIGVGEAA